MFRRREVVPDSSRQTETIECMQVFAKQRNVGLFMTQSKISHTWLLDEKFFFTVGRLLTRVGIVGGVGGSVHVYRRSFLSLNRL